MPSVSYANTPETYRQLFLDLWDLLNKDIYKLKNNDQSLNPFNLSELRAYNAQSDTSSARHNQRAPNGHVYSRTTTHDWTIEDSSGETTSQTKPLLYLNKLGSISNSGLYLSDISREMSQNNPETLDFSYQYSISLSGFILPNLARDLTRNYINTGDENAKTNDTSLSVMKSLQKNIATTINNLHTKSNHPFSEVYDINLIDEASGDTTSSNLLCAGSINSATTTQLKPTITLLLKNETLKGNHIHKLKGQGVISVEAVTLKITLPPFSSNDLSKNNGYKEQVTADYGKIIGSILSAIY